MDTDSACARIDPLAAASEHAAAEIRRRLSATGYRALRTVECEYRDGLVVLRGRVPSYYCKQLAQSTLLADPFIKTVVNLIEVFYNGRKAVGMDPMQ